MITMLTVDETEEIKKARTEKETDRKCPECGGTMDFNPATGGLLCPYCGHAEEIKVSEKEESGVAELDFESAENAENCDWGAAKKTVICKSCGAESIYDALQISDVCPYCGSNQVTEVNDVKTMSPGGVVTFAVNTKQAGEKFKSWLKLNWFCPKIVKESAKPDAFKGVYIPYWTFDAETFTKYKAQYGIDETKTHTDKDGNTEEETETKWFPTSGTYSESIDDAPVCASSRYDADMLSRIEPFNTADNKVYKPEYLSGFVSERYSVGIKDAWETAKLKIKHHLAGNISSKIREEKDADRVTDLKMDTDYSDIKYKYLLLPVWLSSFKYNGKIYQFFVNGQTGKVGGKTPISPFKVAITVLICLAIVGLIAMAYLKNN